MIRKGLERNANETTHEAPRKRVGWRTIAIALCVAALLVMSGFITQSASSGMLFGILVFASVFILFFVILTTLFPIRPDLGKALKAYGREGKQPTVVKTRKGANIVSAATEMARRRGILSLIQESILLGGLRFQAGEFILFHLLATVLFGFVVKVSFGVVAGSLAILIATIGPILWLQWLAGRRLREVIESLPDVLSLLAGALKSGYSFQQSLDMAAEESSGPLKEELGRTVAETKLGLPVEVALDHLVTRVPAEEVRWAVLAVRIQKQVGGNLAEVLDILAETIRERQTMKRQVKILTTEGRLSAWILFVLPFALGALLLFLNPRYVGLLFSHPIGYGLLGVSGALLVIGGVWLKRIVSVEV